MTAISGHDVAEVAEGSFGLLRPFTLINSPVYERRFRAHFGCSAPEAALLWNLIDTTVQSIEHQRIIWLLSALFFLHCYPTMDVLATKLGKHKDTVRKWVWLFVDYLARIEVVSRYVPAFQCKYFVRLTAHQLLPLTTALLSRSNGRIG